MSVTNARQFVADAVRKANIIGIRSHPNFQAFLEGTGDVNFGDLEMDSLARMELCISIEIGTGVEITPDQLDEIKSLAELVKRISESNK